jgi:hypothetical protein
MKTALECTFRSISANTSRSCFVSFSLPYNFRGRLKIVGTSCFPGTNSSAASVICFL